MPRDATDTKNRLIEEAERLFAVRGIHQATTREILEAAEQRNASALSYHFGSRGGLLAEILRRHGDPLDDQRAHLLGGPVGNLPTRDLVGALLLPYAGCLATEGGRNYLRIVAQLTDRFVLWRVGEVAAEHLHRILDALENRVAADEATQQQRVVGAIMLMTTAMAERARQIDGGVPLKMAEDRFVADLADVIVAGLEAPVGPPLPRPVTGPSKPRR